VIGSPIDANLLDRGLDDIPIFRNTTPWVFPALTSSAAVRAMNGSKTERQGCAALLGCGMIDAGSYLRRGIANERDGSSIDSHRFILIPCRAAHWRSWGSQR
jgi:hypothetical protein